LVRDFWTEVSNVDANDAIVSVLDHAIHLAQGEDVEAQPLHVADTTAPPEAGAA
jgi:hypothetical protein